jgi:hypothetical protein
MMTPGAIGTRYAILSPLQRTMLLQFSMAEE